MSSLYCRDMLNTLNRKIGVYKMNLETYKEKNQIRSSLVEKAKNLEELVFNLNEHLTMLENILVFAKSSDAKYKEKRISFIEDTLASHLDKLFPGEFTPKLLPQVIRNKKTMKLILVDQNGKAHTPKMSAGGMMKSLITFASCISVINLLGTKIIFIDEAFGNGSETKKAEMGDILLSYLNAGVQMIIVSQSSSLYQDLPRREINLRKDSLTQSVVIESMEDWRGENETKV